MSKEVRSTDVLRIVQLCQVALNDPESAWWDGSVEPAAGGV